METKDFDCSHTKTLSTDGVLTLGWANRFPLNNNHNSFETSSLHQNYKITDHRAEHTMGSSRYTLCRACNCLQTFVMPRILVQQISGPFHVFMHSERMLIAPTGLFSNSSTGIPLAMTSLQRVPNP